jgi:hypothetical protein
VLLLPSLYTPHPGVNTTIAPSGLSQPPSPIYRLPLRATPAAITYLPASSPSSPSRHRLSTGFLSELSQPPSPIGLSRKPVLSLLCSRSEARAKPAGLSI